MSTKTLWITVLSLVLALVACTGVPATPPAAAVPLTTAQGATTATEASGTAAVAETTENQIPNPSTDPAGLSSSTTLDSTQNHPQAVPTDDDKPEPVRFSGTVAVPGTGRATRSPDFIRIHLGAYQKGNKPLEVMKAVTRATKAMTDEAISQGILEQDIQTGTFKVQELTVFDHVTSQTRHDGYSATQHTTVTIRDIHRSNEIAGQLIWAIDSAGDADLVLDGFTSGLDDPEGLRLKALEKATANLWAQARMVANKSNRDICRLLEAQAMGAGQYHGQTGLVIEAPEIKPVGAESHSRSTYRGDVSVSPGTIEDTAWMTGLFKLVPIGATQPQQDCKPGP